MPSPTKTKQDGVQLKKYYEETEFEQPSIVYVFESLRVQPVTIQLTETVPDNIDPEDIRFHMVHGSQYWSITEQELRFEYELEPDSEYRTVYAVNPDAPGDTRDMMGPQDEFTVDPPVEMVRGGSTTADSPKSVESTTPEMPKNEAPNTPSPDEDPTDSVENRTDRNDTDSATNHVPIERQNPELRRNGSAIDAASMVDQLVAELKAGNVSDKSLHYLREEIGNQYQSRSVDVKIKQLQTDLSELRAYTNALETFLDENGTAEEVIVRFESQMDSFEADLASLETSVEEHDSAIESHDQDIRDIQEDLGTMADNLSSLKEEVAEISSEVTQVANDLEQYEIESRFDDVEKQLTEMAQLRENLKEVFEPRAE